MTTIAVLILALSLIQVLSCSGVDDSTQFVTNYELYHMMESALLSNNQTMYEIQQHFFIYKGYTFNNHYTLMFIYNACLTVDKLHCPLDDEAVNRSYHKCWNVQWTDSVLVNLISGDIITELDPFSGLIRNNFVRSTKKASLSNLHIHLNKLPCLSEKVNLKNEFDNLLTWVS